MKNRLRDIFIGKPLKDSDLGGEKFGVLWGLPIYSSDTISSVAYAGEEVLMVLLPVMGLLAAHTSCARSLRCCLFSCSATGRR